MESLEYCTIAPCRSWRFHLGFVRRKLRAREFEMETLGTGTAYAGALCTRHRSTELQSEIISIWSNFTPSQGSNCTTMCPTTFFFILLKKRTRNVFPQKHFLATSDGEKSVSKMRFCTKQYNLFNQNTYKWLLSRLLIIFLERKLWNFIWIIENRTNVLKILILNLYVTILHNLYVFPIVRYI